MIKDFVDKEKARNGKGKSRAAKGKGKAAARR